MKLFLLLLSLTIVISCTPSEEEIHSAENMHHEQAGADKEDCDDKAPMKVDENGMEVVDLQGGEEGCTLE